MRRHSHSVKPLDGMSMLLLLQLGFSRHFTRQFFDLNPFVRHSFFSLTFGGAGMVLSIYATNQTSVQRYLACKDLKTTRTAIHLNLPLNIVFMTLQCLGGLVSYATFVGCDPKLNGETTASDQILPYLIMKLFNHIPVVRGLFISSILAAALSTLSSGINSIAGVIMEDVFVEAFFLCRPGACISQRKLTLFARLLAILIGLITIGVAFLLSIVSSGVLQISFSIFGAIGGPILTVFTLGIIMPFVNQWGGLIGFLASLATGLTLTVGALFSNYRQIPEVPLTNANCSTNATAVFTSILRGTNVTASNDIPFNFFNLSYLYYSPVCLIVGVIIGSLVSFATGMSAKRPVSHSLLAWQAVKLYSYLPNCVSPQSTPEPVTSAHKAKLNILVKEGQDEKLEGQEGDKGGKGFTTASVLSNTSMF
uniref:Sodium-coupled monocarboxylate transporter 1 n=1 Tax=Schistocephalus solidus TaxID=70667 RepID=A0A0X3PTD1_SCHSO